jgi:hypothetical protein
MSRENEFVGGGPEDYPIVKVDVIINCLSADETKQPAAKAKKGRKRRWEQYYGMTLTVLVLRTDGKLICNRAMP